MAPKPNPNRALNAKQALFVVHYLADEKMNATNAALAAGYSPRNAAKYAHELMQLPHVKAAIEAAMGERIERTQIDADYVLRQAVKLHERCMQEIRPFTDRSGEQVHDEDGHPLFVFNAQGAVKALELVGKHVGVGAFRDKLDLTNSDGSLAPKVIDASQLSTEALRELAEVLNVQPSETDGS